MNLRDLRYIAAVAENKHFAKAAEISNVSQPTLSMQIQKLENELGVKIFERNNKNILITEIGQKIINKAKIIIKEADDIKELAKISKDPFSGDLKFGAFPTIAPYLFPKISSKIIKKFPKLKLFLLEEKTEILIKKLQNAEIDLAIIALPINALGLEYKELFTEEFFLAVNKNHPLANKKSINRSDLFGQKIMLLEEGHCLRDQALELCSVMGGLEDQNFRATSLETLKQMISIGNGVTLVPKIAANKDDKNIKYLKFSSHAPCRKIALVWRKTSPRNDLFLEIKKIISSF
jgi:LysR family hydrogen peroxide-inducible transcriptional activator